MLCCGYRLTYRGAAELRGELNDLSELCAEMRSAARRYADEFEDNENIADLLEQHGASVTLDPFRFALHG